MKGKKRCFFALSMAALLTAALAGCGKPDSGLDTPKAETAEAEPTSAAESSDLKPAETPSADTKPTETQQEVSADGTMQTVLQALAGTAADGLHYNSADPVFIWTALAHAAFADGTAQNVPKETLTNYLTAFFEDVEALPEINDAVKHLVTYDEAADSYTFVDDASKGTLVLKNLEDLEDGSYRIKGDYLAADSKEKLSGWIFFLKPQEGAYPYVVQYMENEDYLCSDIYEELQKMTAGESKAPE